MEALINLTTSSPLSIFSTTNSNSITPPSRRPLLPIAASRSKKSDSNSNSNSDSDSDPTIKPWLSPFSKDDAMGLVLSAATGRGWTTGSGMEGPSAPVSGSESDKVSTFPWSLFTKSPRRRMRVAFTCKVCGQRTTRAINPHAYTDGSVFVQCCGCNVFHKLVDNLNLFQEMKCYVGPDFRYKGDANVHFKFWDEGEDDDHEPPSI